MLQQTIGQSAGILESEFIALALVKDRQIIWANKAAHRIFGYAPEELIGQPTRNLFIDQASYELFGREGYAAIEKGQTYHAEIKLRRKDGSSGFFEFNASRLAGSVDTVVAAIIDNTEKHDLNERLKQEEERYRSVVQDQTEIICRFLPDGTIIFVNEVFCRLFGKTQEELVGKKWHPIAHTDDLSMIEAKLREMSPGNPVVIIENRVAVASGDLCWMQFVNRGFYDDAGVLKETQSVGRDITQLKESEERLNLALSGSRLSLWDRDFETGKVVTDKRITEILGYQPEELAVVGAWWQRVDPRDRARVEHIVDTHLRGDSAFIHSEHRLRHREGHWVTVEMRAKVVSRAKDGAPLRLVGTLLDVTQRRRLNEEGTTLLKQIESLIRETSQGSPAEVKDTEALENLTKRERQILGMIADGMNSTQIGAQLKLSPNTVANHRQNMMSKLGLHNTAEVTRFAINHGLMKRQ